MLVSPGVRVTEVDNSHVVAPSNNWRDLLHNLFLLRQFEIKGSKDAEVIMQQQYPGPYRIEIYCDDKQQYDYQLVFDDAQEQTLWLLKHS